ncbi:GNAT family N-acetyltransferase [Cellvibrio sp. OA-2007]|uniref:GNAT family N-acetyltransferase n=1 Tax=Cellvibrio sp. OA-2007 TaxID=529823 RepID=UPI00078282AD|nr:GNAT family N-acetyltransferase [Cellvibrio sp. OA-2007]
MNARNDLLLDNIQFRHPLTSDGDALQALLATTPVLDGNSVQCTLLQCGHFAKTSVAAFWQGQLVGFVSAYYPPTEPQTLFVWQVVVAQEVRHLGLGKTMLHWLVDQPACAQALRLVTAIGIKNSISWSMFDGFARDIGALPIKSFVTPITSSPAQQPEEYLLRIAPLPNRSQQAVSNSLDHLKTSGSHISAMRRWLD